MARTPKHVWAVDTEGPTTLDYALAYAKLGWYVLPVWSVDKDGECRCGHPSTGKHPQADLAPHGHHDSTINEDIIKNWWATDPNAGIGISMSQSGLIALDIDPQNDGQESLLQIEKEHGVLHSDCVAKTQGGGEHRIFTTEADVTYPGILGKGLDLKHHGYICVAPTLGVSGDYKWKRSPLSKSNPALPSSLPAFIKSKARSATEFSLIEHNGVPVATAQTFDDLRSALQHVDADDYTTWVNVATVLKPYGENGYRVWTDWSSKSDKFDAALQRKKWERDISQPHSITYRSIFKMAIDNGWVNTPIQTTPVNLEDHPLGLGRALPSGASEVTVFEYIFDGFMSTGVNVLAGAPGVGKTTLIVPLALSTAHLCHPEFELKPLVKRNVIIITESVVQVQRVIYSICKWGTTGLLSKDFDERVKVLQAYRLDPQIVAQVAEDYKEWTVDNEMEEYIKHYRSWYLTQQTRYSTWKMRTIMPKWAGLWLILNRLSSRFQLLLSAIQRKCWVLESLITLVLVVLVRGLVMPMVYILYSKTVRKMIAQGFLKPLRFVFHPLTQSWVLMLSHIKKFIKMS